MCRVLIWVNSGLLQHMLASQSLLQPPSDKFLHSNPLVGILQNASGSDVDVEFSIDLIQIVRFISRRVDVAIGIESVLVDHISPPHACLLWWACTWMHVSMYVVTIKMAVSGGCTGNISSARGKHCCDHYGTQL